MNSIRYYLDAPERRKILDKRKEEYIDYVSSQTGWNREKAKKEMDSFATQGINYRFYVKKRFWSRTGKKLEVSIKNTLRNRKYDKFSLRKHAELVAGESGWSVRKSKEEILKSNLYTECSPRDYYQFHFWDKSLDEQKAYYTKGTVERMIMKYNTDIEEVEVLRDKEKFSLQFGDLFLGPLVLGLDQPLDQLGGFVPELVVAHIHLDLAVVHVHDVGADGVQEVTVMGDHQSERLAVHQEVLQPLDGLDVQVVGRLVQQDDVGLAASNQCSGTGYELVEVLAEASSHDLPGIESGILGVFRVNQDIALIVGDDGNGFVTIRFEGPCKIDGQCGLSRSVRTKKPKHLTLLQAEADIVHRLVSSGIDF